MALKLIKSLAKAKADATSVKNLIHSSLAGVEPPRPHGPVHASDLMQELEFCPREWAFRDLGVAKKPSQFVGTALRITFDHGSDMEWRLRNVWIRDHMVGYWRCGVCGHLHDSFGKFPKITCPSCGWVGKWEYSEVRLDDPKTGITCGIDGFVDLGTSKLQLLEIKSMDKDEFKKLVAPLAEHKFRTALYLTMGSSLPWSGRGRINTSFASVLYVSKSYGFKDTSLKEAGIKDSPFSPLKEFAVSNEPALIAIPVAKAIALQQYRRMVAESSSPGLPCGICHSGLSKRAQSCSAVGPCFSGSYPATITWTENGVVRHPGKPIVV